MSLDNLIKASSSGVARFLRLAEEMGIKPLAADYAGHVRDAWTMVYGVGEETYMLVYAVDAGEKKYPMQGTIRKITRLKGDFDRKELLEQGRKNVGNEMSTGEMSPFVSEHFDIRKLHIIIDQACIENNEMARFPTGEGSYFAMGLKDVLQALQILYGKEKAETWHLFNNNSRQDRKSVV